MEKNEKIDLSTLPYTKWLEEAVAGIIGMPVESICILTKYDNGSVQTGYYKCSVSDQLLFSGYINQDAMIETLKMNGLVKRDDEGDDDLDG
jgi:hypothetical protein